MRWLRKECTELIYGLMDSDCADSDGILVSILHIKIILGARRDHECHRPDSFLVPPTLSIGYLNILTQLHQSVYSD